MKYRTNEPITRRNITLLHYSNTPLHLFFLSFLFLSFLFLPSAACRAAYPSVAFPVIGEPFRAVVSRIDQNGNMTFDTGAARQVYSPADIVSCGAQLDNERGPQIVMADGGLLIAETLVIRGEQLEFETRHFGPSRLPLKFVRGIIFQPPADTLDRDRLLHRVATAQGQEDQLLLANGDVLRGSLMMRADEEGGATIRLETGTRQIDVARDRVAAVIFNPALVAPPKPQATAMRLGLRDGSCVVVESLVPKQDRLQLLLPGGIKLETYPGLAPPEFFADLTLIQPLSAKIEYLSDFQPLSYKHVPYTTIDWPYGVDRNLLGGQLRWGDRIYAKGISMHSTSRLAVDLRGRYRRFAAELALDAHANNLGSVEYRVYLQGTDGSWQRAYASPVIRGGDEPLHIQIDVAGAARMALIVDWADRGDTMDHANWLNARMIE